MMIELTMPEIEALRESLEAHRSELMMEIANTDDRKMKEGLRERDERLRAILGKLGFEERGVA